MGSLKKAALIAAKSNVSAATANLVATVKSGSKIIDDQSNKFV